MNSFLRTFTHWFNPEVFRQLARQTLWHQRPGKIDAYDFLLSAVLGQASALRLTLDSQSRSLAEPVSRQAIDQRYHERTVDFFHRSFDHVLAEALAPSPRAGLAESLGAHFRAVYLLDSTCWDAPGSLQSIFPSCGGDGSAANVKLLLRYECLSGQFHPQALLPGKKSDQGLAAAAAGRLQAGELQIQDKGFYDAAAWHAVQQAGAYLLMPWPRSVTVWARPAPGQPEQPLDVAATLAGATTARVEWAEVAFGQKERRVAGLRLTAFRLSLESAQRQRAKLREAQRCQGRVPTRQALELAGWLILITNVPVTKLPTDQIAYLYRLRWQVELIFRQCKTTLRLDQARGDNPHRTQCEIWARLLAAVFLFLWHGHANALCWLQHRREISFEKVACLIQQKAHSLARALRVGGAYLREILEELWRCILKTARKGRQKTRTNSGDRLEAFGPALPAPA